MKKNMLLVIITALVLNLTFMSCDNENDDPISNEFTYNEISHELSQGLLEYYGEVEPGLYNYDIALFTSVINYDEETPDSLNGSGDLIYFELYSSSANEISSGSYLFSNNLAANVFDQAEFVFDLIIDSGSTGFESAIKNGVVNIEKEGDIYTIDFDCIDFLGKSITGYYKGDLYYNDWSEIGKLPTSSKNNIKTIIK